MTLTAQTACTLIAQPATMHEQWCVYEHHLHDAATGASSVIYINACRLRDVYAMIDARKNSEWLKISKADPAAWLFIKITHVGDKLECRREAHRLTHTHDPLPRCNLRGFDLYGSARPIKCSNGKTYGTQLEAATDLGVSQGAISRCMSGLIDHVKGFTFAYDDGGV